MSNNNNLEEFFRNSFEDFDGKPSNEVWNSIAKDREMKHELGLTEQTPESVFSRAFGNFTSNPSNKVWSGVREYLLKKMFYRRLKYTLISLLFIGFASSIYVYNSSNLEASNAKNGNKDITPSLFNAQTSQSILTQSNQPSNEVNASEDNKITLPANIENEAFVVSNSKSLKGNLLASSSKKFLTNFESPSKSTSRNQVIYSTQNEETGIKNNNQLQVNNLVSDEEKVKESPKNAEVEKIETSKPNEVKDAEIKTKPKSIKKTNTLKDNSKVSNFVKYTKETDINNEESGIKIGIMAGLDYGNFTLKGGSDLYKDVRKNQELFRATSYHTGLTFSKMINSNWYIQANAVFANQAMNVAYDKKKVVSDTTRDGFGNITKIENKTIFSVDTNTHYAFSTIEIPFLLGYRIGEKRWTFHALLGPSWNLIVSKRGEMLSANSMQVAPVADNQLIPTVKHVWGIWAAVGASYQLNHHYSLTIEPMFRYKINSIFNANYSAKQYNYATGINLGIRYHLF
ncbi:MAG: outer membrane beta-barrel protein [Bacteroidetes bacterium]|nr:outer membrane beta-barrel protein [Bacteroidota bacterium]